MLFVTDAFSLQSGINILNSDPDHYLKMEIITNDCAVDLAKRFYKVSAISQNAAISSYALIFKKLLGIEIKTDKTLSEINVTDVILLCKWKNVILPQDIDDIIADHVIWSEIRFLSR